MSGDEDSKDPRPEDGQGKPGKGSAEGSASGEHSGTPARARDQAEAAVRVSHIRWLMLRGEWRGKYTSAALAGEWAVDPSTVRDYAAEASRQVALLRDETSLEQAEADMAAWLASVERVVHEALSNERVYVTKKGDEVRVPEPNYRAALKGLEMLAAAKGIATTPDAIQMMTTAWNALVQHCASTMSPDAYAELYRALGEFKATTSKRLPSKVVVKVERSEE